MPSCAAIPETACFYKQFAQLGMIQNGNCSTMSSQFVSDMGAINKASYEGYYDNYNVDKALALDLNLNPDPINPTPNPSPVYSRE